MTQTNESRTIESAIAGQRISVRKRLKPNHSPPASRAVFPYAHQIFRSLIILGNKFDYITRQSYFNCHSEWEAFSNAFPTFEGSLDF